MVWARGVSDRAGQCAGGGGGDDDDDGGAGGDVGGVHGRGRRHRCPPHRDHHNSQATRAAEIGFSTVARRRER